MTDPADNNTPVKTARPSRRSAVAGMLLKYGVPPVITVGLCLLLFRDLDPARMWHTICTECDFRWIWANFALNVAAHVARAARWQIQLRALDIRPTLWQLVLSIFGTYAVNLVFPRLGEVWRTGYIAQRRNAPFTKVFGSKVAERLSDTVVVGLISLATFMVAGSTFSAYLTRFSDTSRIASFLVSPLLWGCVAAVILVVTWVFVRFPGNRVVAAVRRIWRGLWEGFSVILSMPGKGYWLLLTACLWTCYFLALWCAFMSFPLTADVIASHGIIALLVCYVLTSLSMAIPSNGGIGPWQWAMILGLGLYSVPGLTHEYATTFANLVMGVQTIGLVFLGIFTFICIAFSKRSAK